MALSLQVVFLLSLTSGLFIAGAMSQAAEPEEPSCRPACAPGWTKFGQRCFTFYMRAKTWADAELACIGVGGNLASVHSADENKFLSDLVEQAATYRGLLVWLSGYDAVQDKTWFWSNGKPFDYTAWTNGQPDNRAGENCIEMGYSGLNWADTKCNNRRPYICAKDVK